MGIISSVFSTSLFLLLPNLVACQQPPESKRAQVTHTFSSRTSLIEHGDTLILITSAAPVGSAVPIHDTSVYLRHSDSSMTQLRPNGPRKLDPNHAHILYSLMRILKEEEETEKKLGRSLHN